MNTTQFLRGFLATVLLATATHGQSCADYDVTAPGNFSGNTCGEVDDCELQYDEDVSYSVTVPNDGLWTFSMCGSSDFDTYMAIGTTCCGTDVGTNDDFCGLNGYDSQITADLTAGIYVVTITSYDDGCGDYVLNIREEPKVTRIDNSTKGSLLIYSQVDLRWDASGTLIQDTVLEMTNDLEQDVYVQFYFVNGDDPRDAISAGDPPQVIAEAEPGWNWTDLQLLLTGNQPVYWSASTGLPLGTAPFEILDPDNGNGPGRPTADGGRMLRGFIYAWTVDAYGYPIRWNHLSGSATVVNYATQTAWEYNAWSIQAYGDEDCNAHDSGGTGELNMDGKMYNLVHDMLLIDFYASGSRALSSDAVSVSVDMDLTLHPVSVDFRSNSFGPITTKAKFDIWNENERRFSGTERCITCWDQTLLSDYQAPNHFLIQNLQTDRGKARVDGIQSPACESGCVRRLNNLAGGNGFPGNDATVCSGDAALLGVVSKVLAFEGSSSRVARSGRSVVGMGTQEAFILHDIATAGSTPPLDLCCNTNCDDGIDCTIDTCEPAVGCLYELDDSPASCGDGNVCGAEQCDDGNSISGDGCSASCLFECPCFDAALIADFVGRCQNQNFLGDRGDCSLGHDSEDTAWTCVSDGRVPICGGGSGTEPFSLALATTHGCDFNDFTCIARDNIDSVPCIIVSINAQEFEACRNLMHDAFVD
jgi:cysteine-rich repeat protein